MSRILVLSQMFWPDEVAVSQILTDLCVHLNDKGHSVTVLCSNQSYEDAQKKYTSKENYQGIEIKRIRHFAFKKGSVFSRAVSIASFNLLLFLKLLFLPRKKYDLIIGLTNPPLVSFLGVLIKKLKGIAFLFWVMDIQPEMSFRLNFLKRSSIVARLLHWMNMYSFKHADSIVVLDRFMKSFLAKKVSSEKVELVSLWATSVSMDVPVKAENPFRKAHGLEDKFVVMYSGNHSIAHPLETLLEAAHILRNEDSIKFLFIGSGVRKQEVVKKIATDTLTNVLSLPAQKRNEIHLSLSAADLQVVIMGLDLAGVTHPSKIYTAMHLGNPILYIGPQGSHVVDLLSNGSRNIFHGEDVPNVLAKKILDFSRLSEADRMEIGKENKARLLSSSTKEIALEKMRNKIEACAKI